MMSSEEDSGDESYCPVGLRAKDGGTPRTNIVADTSVIEVYYMKDVRISCGVGCLVGR
jgi:hypothetical protein